MHLSRLPLSAISLNELATIPLFLRFYTVLLAYNFGAETIEEKCELIKKQLLPLKLALNDTNMVEFIACISQNNHNHFNDHSKLLDFIRNRFLPICNSSRRYKFQIRFNSDANSDRNVITLILEMDEIKRCSNVEIEIIGGKQKRLPIEEISNWLERSADGAKNNIQNQTERFLKIYYNYYLNPVIKNAREMLEHLTKVYFIYFMAD